MKTSKERIEELEKRVVKLEFNTMQNNQLIEELLKLLGINESSRGYRMRINKVSIEVHEFGVLVTEPMLVSHMPALQAFTDALYPNEKLVHDGALAGKLGVLMCICTVENSDRWRKELGYLGVREGGFVVWEDSDPEHKAKLEGVVHE